MMVVRTRLLRAGAFGGLIVIGAGYAVRPLFDAGEVYPWKAAAFFVVVIAIALRGVWQHPFAALGPANRVTHRTGDAGIAARGARRRASLPRAAGHGGRGGDCRRDPRRRRRMAGAAQRDGERVWRAVRHGTDALLVLVLSILVWQHDKAGAWVMPAG